MSAIKKSITLPKTLDSYVLKRAKQTAKARGETTPNYSAALADLIIAAKSRDNARGASELKEAA